MRIGTAGWSIPKECASAFPDDGSHLERYSAIFNAVEINSSFYRPHRSSTYERWASAVPEEFRFAVKIPKVITHERRLKDTDDLLIRFLNDVTCLGAKLGPLLLQLPPSLTFDPEIASKFLKTLRKHALVSIICEPRHASWFTSDVDRLLDDLQIARVAADPPPIPAAGKPGGWTGLHYYRLHGSPRIYYSAYSQESLATIAEELASSTARQIETWCIFDNTAAFAATGNALTTRSLLQVPT
ncbi:DUF72 domain-containing protein [Microvirga rosea]|uniref:DUF72 domain-containing protein n=1 Tax=Microvirga rosea TaxID=2715425 RepID=UPI001D0B5B9C|nr:DUF72 domain-containing protein [Microvirga rosea]MCB8821247.1 DUF72 domain-containing protein [Microvirga rosea]